MTDFYLDAIAKALASGFTGLATALMKLRQKKLSPHANSRLTRNARKG